MSRIGIGTERLSPDTHPRITPDIPHHTPSRTGSPPNPQDPDHQFMMLRIGIGTERSEPPPDTPETHTHTQDLTQEMLKIGTGTRKSTIGTGTERFKIGTGTRKFKIGTGTRKSKIGIGIRKSNTRRRSKIGTGMLKLNPEPTLDTETTTMLSTRTAKDTIEKIL